MASDQDAPEIGPSLRLAELLCARLCYDLGRMAGTVSGTKGAEPGLLAWLDLARAAWDDGDIRDMTTLRRLALVLPRSNRIGVDLAAEDGAIPAGMGRVLLNLVMTAAECLPRGGTINLARPGPAEFVLLPEGPGAAWPAGFAGWIANPATAWRALDGARAFQAPLSVLVAAAKGCRLSLLMGAGPDAPPLLVTGPGRPADSAG